VSSGRARRPKHWPTERVLYAETYYKGARAFRPDSLPTTRHTNVYQPREGYIIGAGTIERPDGTRLEYHDVRLYFPHDSAEKTNNGG